MDPKTPTEKRITNRMRTILMVFGIHKYLIYTNLTKKKVIN